MYKNIFLKKYFKFFLVVFFSFTYLQTSFAQFGLSYQIPSSQLNNCSPVTNRNNFKQCSDGKYYDCSYNSGTTGQTWCKEVPENDAKGISGGCGLTNFSLAGCFISVVDFVFGWILDKINSILSWFVNIASWIFDFTVYTTIVKFKQNFVDLKLNISGDTLSYTNVGVGLLGAQGASLIDYVWGIIRDTLNIFIFILVIYSAVRSMFEGFENTRKKFVWLLVFSIVVNFSLLFVKLAIDVSNIVALQAYTLAVKPAGTADFSQFRTAANNQDSKSYGEYIMNSIDLNKILDKKTGAKLADTEIMKGVQSTFMFQLGRFIVYVGIIYILLYMSGVLIARAVNFLLAMILAPLIAAEIFFTTVGKNAGSQTQELIKKIQGITGKTKNNFGEALVKGPLLIFVIFLIGVFADSIVGAGIMNEITRGVEGLPGAKDLESTVSVSVFVFFKFVIFFALCKVLFSKLDEMTSGFGGSGMISNWGSKFANFTLGRGMSAMGWAGRNTIGRAASNPNSTFGKVINNVRDYGSKLQSNQYSTIRGAGKIITNSAKGLREGSYDLRQSKTLNSKLGEKVLGAAGIKNMKEFGDSKGYGYEKVIEEREKEEKKKIEQAIKDAGKDVAVNAADIKKAKSKTKIAGITQTLDDYDTLVGDKYFLEQLKITPTGSGMREFGLKPEEVEFFKKAVKGDDKEILTKIDKAREEASKKASSEKDSRVKEEFKKPIAKKAAEGKYSQATTAEYISDNLSLRRKEIKESVAAKMRIAQAKEGDEKKKESKKIVDFITNKFSGSVSSMREDLKKVAQKQIESINKSSKSSLEKKEAIAKVNKDTEDLDKGLKDFFGTLPKFYTTKEDDLKKALESFDKETYKKVMDAKKKAHEHIIETVSNLSKDPNLDVNSLVRNIGKRTANLAEMDDLYKKAKPEHKEDHGKDKAGKDSGGKDSGGDAKGGDKKEPAH